MGFSKNRCISPANEGGDIRRILLKYLRVTNYEQQWLCRISVEKLAKVVLAVI